MRRSTMGMVLPLGLMLMVGSWAGQAMGQEPAQDAAAAAEKEETVDGETASVWMKKKLQLSGNLLGGIATGDFDQIIKSAHSMRTLSKFETFVRRSTPGYRTQVDIFENALDEIIRQAKKENVEGAALGFNQLTLSCVSCHKHLREKK
jgi:hypothetical protein